jgi:hypothetical protein
MPVMACKIEKVEREGDNASGFPSTREVSFKEFQLFQQRVGEEEKEP